MHAVWCLAAGGTLEDRPRYTSKTTFLPFPFPAPTDQQRTRIRELAEELDAHRKRQQAAHPELTLTNMYNVLEKLRAGAHLSAKEQTIHEQGLCAVLRKLHDELDAAVFDAYGWPADLPDEAILENLVRLNKERAEEERNGVVWWLRPEFQAPHATGPRQEDLESLDKRAKRAASSPIRAAAAWPKELVDRFEAIQTALAALNAPANAESVARS